MQSKSPKSYKMSMVMKPLKVGNFSGIDVQRLGRPVEHNEDEIKTITEVVRHVTTREIAKKLKI